MPLYCPRCGSQNIFTEKKGYSVGKGLVGAFFLGGLGLVAGAIGHNKLTCRCLECGRKFSFDDGMVPRVARQFQNNELPRNISENKLDSQLHKIADWIIDNHNGIKCFDKAFHLSSSEYVDILNQLEQIGFLSHSENYRRTILIKTKEELEVLFKNIEENLEGLTIDE